MDAGFKIKKEERNSFACSSSPVKKASEKKVFQTFERAVRPAAVRSVVKFGRPVNHTEVFISFK